jgi:tRNA threonylcarbamoyladenosine biosynthesis protein TsaB
LAYILQIETSHPTCSVSIAQNGLTVHEITGTAVNDHAGHLAPMISECADICQIGISDIAAVAVSIGPGSYTGLRIGLSTAKGLCYGLKVPLICISTLASMSAGARYQLKDAVPDYLCPLIDARRMEVYTALYDSNLHEVIAPAPLVVSSVPMRNIIDIEKSIVYFGSGTDKLSELLLGEKNSILTNFKVLSSYMSELAINAFHGGNFADIAYTEPTYLKEFYTTQKQ